MNASDTPNRCQASCEAPTPDGIHLCRTHTDQLSADLRRVPDIIADIEVTITRQDKLAPHTDRRSTADSPLFWNERAAQAKWELGATLSAWARETASVDEDDRDRLDALPACDPSKLARWIRRNLGALTRHPDVGQAHDELTNAVWRARRAVDHPNTRTRFQVGPCPQDINGELCDGQVWAFIASSDDGVSFLRCIDCDTQWDSTQWLRVGPRIYRRAQVLKAAS